MAGMEQLEIHSKSYIVRWVKVDEGHTISWSVQPHKKSINFGIVKHPGTGAQSTVSLQLPNQRNDSEPSVHSATIDSTDHTGRSRRASTARNDNSTAEEQLKSKGFISIQWLGKCDADKVTIGTYAVGQGCSGMYGLVFDNTFSKTVSKTATFVLLTYPSNAPPNSTHHNLHGAPGSMSQALNNAGVARKTSKPNFASESVDSFHSHSQSVSSSRATSSAGKPQDGQGPTFHVGILHKRRRKRGQGYARRYFSLDFVSCTLSYYHSRSSSALRGAIPLSLAAISADARRREISIDSGAEIWHLKAANDKDFKDWTKALELASNKARGNVPEVTTASPKEPGMPPRLHTRTNSMYTRPTGRAPSEEDLEWDQVESLVSRIVGTRDAVRRLANDTKVVHRQSISNSLALGQSSTSTPSIHEESGDYFAGAPAAGTAPERRPFWKRKPSNNSSSSQSTLKKPGNRVSSVTSSLGASIATQMSPALPATSNHTSAPGSTMPSPRGQPQSIQEEGSNIHKHCNALLSDLDLVLADFNNLITRSKQRRFPPVPTSPLPRASLDSTRTDEFFDAEEGDPNDSQLMPIHHHDHHEGEAPSEHSAEDDDQLLSDAESVASDLDDEPPASGIAPFFPPKPKSLAPLPVQTAPKRRTTIKPATVPPPSLISFLRKNVGKDLSTIAMPVSANEPTSALQRLAESLEYAQLLDAAAKESEPHMRHLLITAFAISYFSTNRAKERATRKPFNPMLGETFELVRAEPENPGNFRFIAEKVSHRPVKMACQADSPLWSYTHSSTPTQKFWGKSAEIITDGRVHVVLRLKDGGDECYSWPIANIFLRNVVMGEKYVEPVGAIAVLNETSGASCTVEFKSKGMWGGRSEDVEAVLHSSSGSATPHGLVGTWTGSVSRTENGKAKEKIWTVGDLVPGPETRYGMPVFAASLNEITDIEKGKCAITDSRLRKDQRLAEDGRLDEAEGCKAAIEEKQRERRRQMESEGREWVPRWFELSESAGAGEECWKLKTGGRGYWEERDGGKWFGVEDVLCVKSGL